jgi:predicted NAD/FAD-binding protein
MPSTDRNLTIAVIGSGISGITASYLLKKQHDVTLFEKNDYVGGHTHTVVIQEITYTHPVYTFDSFATQAELKTLNGQQNMYFCGAYFGYGFHEDGVKSAMDVAGQFGISL